MTILSSVAAMNLGLLWQNYAEFRGGGPKMPNQITKAFQIASVTSKTRAISLLLVSSLVLVISAFALHQKFYWLITMIAAALIFNAAAQLFTSIQNRSYEPGTLAGLLVMAPTAIWALFATQFSGGWIAMLSGPVLSVLFLILVWLLANFLSNKLS